MLGPNRALTLKGQLLHSCESKVNMKMWLGSQKLLYLNNHIFL